MRKRNVWGWGYEDAAVDAEGRRKLGLLLSTQMDLSGLAPLDPPASLSLPRSRLEGVDAPCALSLVPEDRAGHTYGKAFRDLVRGLRGDYRVAPDAVAHPSREDELVALLDWCGDRGVRAIPYGGGSSVVGGVEARFRDEVPAVISIDLGRLTGVREIDVTSRAARIAAGTLGPDLEAGLAGEGLSLRHYPQSFELSTLGGWIATRAGGHFATLYTHIDDLVESMRVVTPRGVVETRRLPASGAGPSPDRMFLGSEGTLGIITEAWMRLSPRPTYRASAVVAFPDFLAGARATRLIAQAGLHPANCRLLDPGEALVAGVGDGSTAYLLLAFESGDSPRDAWLARALEIAAEAGGIRQERPAPAALAIGDLVAAEGDAAARWRKTFLRAPYLRDALVRLGAVTETFETATVWCDFESFHRAVMTTARDVVDRVCGGGLVTCRLTHVYPDGAAPYYTVIAPGRPNGQLAQWDEIKGAVSEAIVTAGGTITHHHAVGRDHRPGYDRQRPPLFAEVLVAAKRTLDPAGILNPGVLVDPAPA